MGGRGFLILLLACAPLLAPAVAAQPLPPSLTLHLEAFPEARPLQGVVFANLTIDASCAMLRTDGQPVKGLLKVVEAPPYASVVATPATFVVDPAACKGGVVRVEGRVLASVDQTAPARKPANVVIEATTEAIPAGTARANASLSAAYFPMLDVAVPEGMAVVSPGSSRSFDVDLTNLGNDRTLVRATLANATPGLSVALFPDVTLGSRAQGDASTTARVALVLTTPRASGVVNDVYSATVEVVGVDAKDPASGAEERSSVSLVLTSKGVTVPATAPLAALAAAAFVARRRLAP